MSAPTDRELLEQAAKAAGITFVSFVDGIFGTGINRGETEGGLWNPLTDAGDRYRLAQALGMNIDFADCFVWKRMETGVVLQEFWGADYEGDDDAHAIVRLAAVVGRAQ